MFGNNTGFWRVVLKSLFDPTQLSQDEIAGVSDIHILVWSIFVHKKLTTCFGRINWIYRFQVSFQEIKITKLFVFIWDICLRFLDNCWLTGFEFFPEGTSRTKKLPTGRYLPFCPSTWTDDLADKLERGRYHRQHIGLFYPFSNWWVNKYMNHREHLQNVA